ncbi:ribbon-helix-helix domain-containing protein [Methylobacterium crusticola]|uniref:ribbon-helix-helix domain-containing protein n=1 Tax=Methylobacterium crusticola TaxID=1697972 RepID=UPI000FFC7E15|nr:ribbon-helix-helix domain-containing protein [Methylobacterium crusticola]
MKPRPRLGLGLAESATDPVALGVPVLQVVPAPEDAPAPSPTQEASAPSKKAKKYDRASTRVGTRGVTVWLEPDGFRTLKMLSAERDKTVQDLMTEAVNLLFRKYDKARVLKS